ncbi:uncharacterized protein JCM15063_004548 [Sporobolomyces koalae]|uniref:uncharacterized protein n=1 Tax=Sporobolomyces koalae TaxID=500713 RepID=UPI003180B52F
MSTDSPTVSIKKRKGPKVSTSKLSFGTNAADANESTPIENEQDEGPAVVIRNRRKKTPAGRVKDREGGGGTKSSFGTSSNNMQVDDEEQDGPTVIKRSSSSTPRRGLLRAQSTTAASTPNPTTSTPGGTPSSSVYSKEYLDQLKNSQLSAPRPAATTTDRSNGEYDGLTLSKFGTIDDASSTIPTSNAIAQAKARREEMRKSGLEDGYISLSSGSGTGSTLAVGFANKGGDSRLVREEDELGDGDEDLAAYTGSMDKIPLGRKANREAAIKLRGEMGDMIDDVEGDVSGEDEEMKRWEDAQIRRGGDGDRTTKEPQADVKQTYRSAPIPQSTTVPSLAAVTSRLTLSLSTLESSHTLDAASLEHFVKERQDLDKQEQELRQEVETVEKKSRWFEEFKDTVEDWAAFLDEKFPQLERIEKEYLNIQKERFDIISKRRVADDSDDVALFTGSRVPTDPLVSDREAETLEEDGNANEVELDPRSVTRTTRRAERQRRYTESTSTAPSVYPDPIEDPGYGSDSALAAAQTSDLAEALSALHRSLEDLFKDVKVDDYRDPNLGIRRKFQEWRELYREEYAMMFGALGLVGVWEFWARVEMSSWNPFEIEQLPKTHSDLSQYAWHQALSSYGHRDTDEVEESDESTEPLDESTEVVNALVTSVVIPRLEKLARESYDPLSSRQTVAAIRLVDEMSYCVERDSPKFESLVQAFLYRLRMQVHVAQQLLVPYESNLSVPALAYDPSTFLTRQHFLSRQVKLVRTCMRWRRLMRSLRMPVQVVPSCHAGEDEVELPGGGEGFDVLVTRELVAKVILPVVEVAWSTGGHEIAQRCLDALPKDNSMVNPALRRRLEGEGVVRR